MTIRKATTRTDPWINVTRLQAQIDDLISRMATLEAQGFVFARGETALTGSSATTTVAVTDLLSTDEVLITPVDAGAASLDGAAYVSSVATGQFVLTHDNSTLTRTYAWAAVREP